MKFGIDMGHNCPPDTGATGIKVEDNLTKDVGTRLMTKLAAAGHSVVNCTPSSASSVSASLQKRVDKANNSNVDIYISIHFNAFNGTASGTEIFALSSASQAIAQSVLNKITQLGFIDRGVRDKPAFFVIKNTSMPAILVECCFVDSVSDMGRFDADKMAEAIKEGLIGQTNHVGVLHPATLTIKAKTILKPSTSQSSSISPSELFEINPGSYPVIDSRHEEKHYWVKFADNKFGGRSEHFIFEDFAIIK
jgi:N-acetylmuramoyl-L-alanine amidase